MAFTLKPLPFPKDSLGPTMSARTLEHHHDKHHATYVKKLNELIEGSKFESMSLEAIIRATAGSADAKQKKIFNNAAQTWNHDFFWDSLAPNGGGTPPEPLLKRIESAFSSFENFRDKFVAAAVDQFGSGWAWLVARNGQSAHLRHARAVDVRRVGARVLSRLSARARAVRQSGVGKHGELAVRGQAIGRKRSLIAVGPSTPATRWQTHGVSCCGPITEHAPITARCATC